MSSETKNGWKDCPYRPSSKKCLFGGTNCIENPPTDRKEKMTAINEQVELCLQKFILGRTLAGVGEVHHFIQEEN